MSAEVPENSIESRVRIMAKTADTDRDRHISDAEKQGTELLVAAARPLQPILALEKKDRSALTPDEADRLRALKKAIGVVAREYEGLSAADIRQWIEAADLTYDEHDMASLRLGRAPEKSVLEKTWEALSAKERSAVLLAGRDVLAEKTPAQERRLAQLELMVTAVNGYRQRMEEGGANILQKTRFWLLGDEGQKGLGMLVDQFTNDTAPKVARQILLSPDEPVAPILERYGSGHFLEAFRPAGVDFTETADERGFLDQKIAVVRFLRSFEVSDYQTARRLAQEELRTEFDALRDARLLEEAVVQIGDERTIMKVDRKIYWESRDRIRHRKDKDEYLDEIQALDPQITRAEAEEKLEAHLGNLAHQDYLYRLDESLAKEAYDSGVYKTWPPEKQMFFEEYKESVGVGKLDMADESWDMILDELVINAPLIIVSGGVGAVARKGLSWGAQKALEAARIAYAGKKAVTGVRVAAVLGGLGVEATVFSMTHAGLRGEWLFDSPHWAQELMSSFAFLGVFKVAGRVGAGLVKGAEPVLSKIGHPALRKGAEELLIKGNTEAFFMLVMASAQHGVYGGSLQDLQDNFGMEIFRAYVSVGALRVSGGAIHRAGGALLAGSEGGRSRRPSTTQDAAPAEAKGRPAPRRRPRRRMKRKKGKGAAPAPRRRRPETAAESGVMEATGPQPPSRRRRIIRRPEADADATRPVNPSPRPPELMTETGASRPGDTYDSVFDVSQSGSQPELSRTVPEGNPSRRPSASGTEADATTPTGTFSPSERARVREDILEPVPDEFGVMPVMDRAAAKRAEAAEEAAAKERARERDHETAARELYDRMTPAQRELSRECEQAFPDQHPANLRAAIVKGSIKGERMPEAEGIITDVYFLPLSKKNAGGLGQTREIFYRNAQGKLTRKIVKTALAGEKASRDKSNEFFWKQEAVKFLAVEGMGEHPNLMKVHTKILTTKDGKRYLVFEKAGDKGGKDFVDEAAGKARQQAGREGAEAATKEAAGTVERALFQVMAGLAFLWKNGYVHRDVKWQNVMIDSATGQARIIDFGTLSAQPGAAASPHQQLVAEANARELEFLKEQNPESIGMVLSPLRGRSEGVPPPVWHQLAGAMGERGRFTRAYDQLSVFNMIIQAAQKFQEALPGQNLQGTLFGRMVEKADRAFLIDALTAEAAEVELERLYGELEGIFTSR